MTVRLRFLALLASIPLTACGGDEIVTRDCDEHTLYRQPVDHKRVEAPEGLSSLDPEQEMVLPNPSPQPPRPADAPCLDLPPSVLLSGGDDEKAEESDDVAAE
jgi:hypothetical protein